MSEEELSRDAKLPRCGCRGVAAAFYTVYYTSYRGIVRGRARQPD